MLLTDLPEDDLLYIVLFLTYNDLVSLSATCSYLRHVLNKDIVWKRLVGGDPVGLGRLGPVSVDGLLPPPCHQRQLCLRRARLVSNFRNQRFRQLSAPFSAHLEFDAITVNSCTYKNYLFVIESEHAVKVFHLGNETVSEVLDFRPHTTVEYCQVVDDKLVLTQDHQCCVYRITLSPLRLTFLHLIYMGSSVPFAHGALVGNFLFSCYHFMETVKVWDIHSGVMLNQLSSKVKDFNLVIIGHSSKLGAVLFSSRESETSRTAFIFEYSIALKAFTDFSVSVDGIVTEAFGLISDKFNTIMIPRGDKHVSVFVYDRIRSVLVCEREFEDVEYRHLSDDSYLTFNDVLVLHSPESGMKIVRLSNLEIIWEWKIPFHRCAIYDHRVDHGHLVIANALHILVVRTNECVSFWDCQLRRKLFVLSPDCRRFCLNDACTQLIFETPELEQLCVWTFGEASSD